VNFANSIEFASMAVETAGVLIILIGVTFSSVAYLNNLRQGDEAKHAYRAYRVGLGRVILLGLEFLVAADIIRTVGIHRTAENVIMLAAIVVIRTFLSIALDVELEGRWPWRHSEGEESENPVLAKDVPAE
jgi:uncharacterized membrane protein